MSLSSSAFLEVADRIGNRLCRDAIWSDDRCNWLGWTFVAQGATPVPGYRAQGVTRDPGTMKSTAIITVGGLVVFAVFAVWLHPWLIGVRALP